MEPSLLLAEERTRRTVDKETDFLGITLTSTFSSTSSSLLYSENLQLYSLFWMFILKYVSFIFTFDLTCAKRLFSKVTE